MCSTTRNELKRRIADLERKRDALCGAMKYRQQLTWQMQRNHVQKLRTRCLYF